jgi:anti-anti-sigma regulatory factor
VTIDSEYFVGRAIDPDRAMSDGRQEGGDMSTAGAENEELDPKSWLRVELLSHGHMCTLVLRGTLSGTSIAALEAQVDQLGCIPCDLVVVDVSGLTAVDAVGANVLLGLYHYVHGRGGTLRITGASGPIATTLRQYAVEYAEADEAVTSAIDGSAEPSTTPLTDLDGGQALLA